MTHRTLRAEDGFPSDPELDSGSDGEASSGADLELKAKIFRHARALAQAIRTLAGKSGKSVESEPEDRGG